jgi:nucleolar complex protein 2
VLTSVLSPSARPKPSTLKALDFEVLIRAPQQYLRTRVYGEGLVEEATYLLAEWLASPGVQGSIAFPEIVVGVVVTLRKAVKASKSATGGGGGKEVGIVKALVDRIEESAKWVEAKRKGVSFGPGKTGLVQDWEREMRMKVEESPLWKYLKVLRKGRDKRRALIEKVSGSFDRFRPGNLLTFSFSVPGPRWGG